MANVPERSREDGVPFTAALVEGNAAALAAIAAAADESSATVFQHPRWLAPLLATLAVPAGAELFAVIVRQRATGPLVAVLPLLRHRHGLLRVLSVPSLGVSDYGAPLLGPEAPSDQAGAEALWRTVKAKMPKADLAVLENMPARVGGQINPLALVSGAARSKFSRNAIVVEDTVEALLKARGKKYRKEAERCYRLLAEHGAPSFRRAETPEDIRAAYQILDAQQAERRHEKGGRYLLDQPEYRAFYDEVLAAGAPAGFAHIFTLSAGGETCAALFGVSDQDSFTALRISTAGGDWRRLSPGRLIILEAMRYFTARGVRTFDMGIGDYAFKHGFGVEPEPLTELSAALSAKGALALTGRRLKSTLKKSVGVTNAVRSLKFLLGA